MRIFPFLFLVFLCTGIRSRAQYARADAVALSVDAPTPDSLARVLTASFSDDRDKVRAIFRWITANIRYQLRTPKGRKPADDDSTYDGRPADERAAYSVLKRREAVCEGYARLFNTLCRYAGVRSVLLRGYVRNDSDPDNRPFSPNHSWNAVWLDSAWQLVDATWAAGYVRTGSEEFTAALDEFYYLSPPAQFARNHMPEEPGWWLTGDPPALPEFRRGPFRTAAAQKYRLLSATPARGILHGAAGDTVHLRVELREALEPRNFVPPLAPDFEPAFTPQGMASAEPVQSLPARVLDYVYVIRPGDAWLRLQCNGETLLIYRVEGPARAFLAADRE